MAAASTATSSRPPFPAGGSLLQRAMVRFGLRQAPSATAPQSATTADNARPQAMGGGYSGAGYADRFMHWRPLRRDSDADTVRDLPELRGRSRDLIRNSPIAAGAQETQVTHIVGSGLTLQSRIDAKALGMTEDQAAEWQAYTERRFQLWGNSEYCDAAQEQTWYEQQDLSLRTQLESGDAFIVLAKVDPQPDWPFRLALQIAEADRVCNPNGKPDTPDITAGIERSAAGAAIAAHICSKHPSGAMDGARWQRVLFRGSSGRRNLLHLKRKLRPGQTRGIPALAPIIATLKQMTRYSEAEIDAAVNSAAQAVFVKMDPDAFQELFDEDGQANIVNTATRWDGGLQAGRAVNLLPGESIESPALGRPNPNFDPFMTAFTGYIGIALGIPREVLMKSFQSSYSAARAALLDAWRTFSIRRMWLVSKLCQPVYEEWLADEVANGAIAAPGFFADPMVRAAWCGATWSGDGPGALDPLKEAKAARERLDLGITTLAEETVAYDGGDWAIKHRQRAREIQERVADGLQTPVQPGQGGGSAQPGAGAPAPAGAADELDDEGAID